MALNFRFLAAVIIFLKSGRFRLPPEKPSSSKTTACSAADTTLIPVQAQYLSAKGLEQLLQTIQRVRRQINPKLKIEGILMTMTDSRTNYGREIDALIRQVYGSKIRVFEQPVPHSVRAAEISAGGRSIFAHDPKGKVAAAYQSLTREVLADAEKQRKLGAERSR